MTEIWQMTPIGGERVLVIEEMQGAEPFSAYYKGEPIEPPDQRARLVHHRHDAHRTDLLLGIHVFPVVSPRLRAIVEAVEPDSAQFIEVDLVCSETGLVERHYAFMNILGNLDAFDWQRSVYTQMVGVRAVLEAERICLRRKTVGDRQIFRVTAVPSEVFVGKRLHDAVCEASLTGISLTPIECEE